LKNEKNHNKQLPQFVVLLIIIGFIIVFIVQTVQYNRLKKQRELFGTALKAAEEKNALLTAQVTELSSPDRIQLIAEKHFGLQPIRPDQIVIVSVEDTSITTGQMKKNEVLPYHSK